MPPPSKPAIPGAPTPRRWTYAVLIVALLFVLMPFLFWRATWFGGPMTDAQIRSALSGKERPRDIQHALAQLEPRIRAGDPNVRQWYPAIVALVPNPVQQVRLTAAWTMGQDNHAPEFHQALLALLKDSDVMVARNAALALVRFGDNSGHAAIVGMLQPDSVASPVDGRLQQRMKVGDPVNPGTMIARIQTTSGVADVRTSVPGTIAAWNAAENAAVTQEQGIAVIEPSEEMVWEALRALFLMGTPADLPAVERYARPVEGMSNQVREQAQLTTQAIQRRIANQ
jgi:biotin carboxyl carrier protein